MDGGDLINTPKRLYTGQPGTSAGTLYTVPAATKTIIKQIVLCNTDATTTRTITLYFVPNNAGAVGVAGVTNAIVSAYSVAAGDTVTIDLTQVLDAQNDTIQGLQGTAGKVTVHISGVEVA